MIGQRNAINVTHSDKLGRQVGQSAKTMMRHFHLARVKNPRPVWTDLSCRNLHLHQPLLLLRDLQIVGSYSRRNNRRYWRFLHLLLPLLPPLLLLRDLQIVGSYSRRNNRRYWRFLHLLLPLLPPPLLLLRDLQIVESYSQSELLKNS
jgi:hypothetical protein